MVSFTLWCFLQKRLWYWDDFDVVHPEFALVLPVPYSEGAGGVGCDIGLGGDGEGLWVPGGGACDACAR